MTSQKKQSRTARFAAVETLCKLYQKKLPVNSIFDRVIQQNKLPVNERNLAMQLVYGVLRRRQNLDRILQILSNTPIRKLDPLVHQTLAVGLFQLFFLERIPDSAAVNEAVECCKTAKVPKRLHGFVNGILRQAVRQRENLLQQHQTDDSGRLILNHPEWLVKRWQQNFGSKETKRICQANNCEPTLILRVNSPAITPQDFCQKLQETGIDYQNGRYSEEAVILPDFHGSITKIPGFEKGHFQVQDEAAQLASRLLGPFHSGNRYLDGCAGLGGKTSHLLQFAQELKTEIHAVEPEAGRLKKLKENLGRLFPNEAGIIYKSTLQQFCTEHPELMFDGILIDAPCSGSGVIGRHPDIRWNRRPEDLVRYQQEQLALLALAAGQLQPEGVLVYATCSLEPEENQQVVYSFLKDHEDFILTPCSPQLPHLAHRFIEDDFFIPHPSETIDGFFAARLQRRS